jgi:ferredoxin
VSVPRKILESRNAGLLKVGMKMLGSIARRVGGMRMLLRHHPWTDARKTDLRWLPINTDIQMPENVPMPLTLLDRLIEEASHRVIYDFCSCRKAFTCRDHREEIGCLLMGDSAVESPASVSHEVGVDEAKEHARRAIDAGLIPLVGKARVDNSFTGIKDRGRLLTACFCCECCCITRNTRHLHRDILEPMLPRLDGISIEVTDDCAGCGRCAEQCFIQAIQVKEGRAVIGEYCRACGRCATVCPNRAVTIKIDDPEFLEKSYRRIRAHVKFD